MIYRLGKRPLKESTQNDTKYLSPDPRQQWAQQVFVGRISVGWLGPLDIRSRNGPTATCLLTQKKLLPRVPRPIWVKNFFVKTDADSSFLLFSPRRAACVLHSLLFLTGVARSRVEKHSDFQTFLLISNPTKNAYSGPLLSAVDSSRGEKLIIDMYFRCGDLYRQSLHFGLLWSVTSMPRNLLFSPIQDGFVLPC